MQLVDTHGFAISAVINRETILKDRQTNRLLMELREERVQRLQDLEEIYAKEKRLEALTAEVVSTVPPLFSLSHWSSNIQAVHRIQRRH